MTSAREKLEPKVVMQCEWQRGGGGVEAGPCENMWQHRARPFEVMGVLVHVKITLKHPVVRRLKPPVGDPNRIAGALLSALQPLLDESDAGSSRHSDVWPRCIASTSTIAITPPTKSI